MKDSTMTHLLLALILAQLTDHWLVAVMLVAITLLAISEMVSATLNWYLKKISHKPTKEK